VIAFRMMWKDWGLAGALYSQAERFLDLAKQTAAGSEQEGYIRASIVFAVISFEALFFREVIRGYIQEHRETLDPANLTRVEAGLYGKGRGFAGILEAVSDWPRLLTGNDLDADASVYADFKGILDYRNALAHGDITKELRSPLWENKLAQEIETVANAELALHTISEMRKAAALGFGFLQLT
jgi:hypothetical protein